MQITKKTFLRQKNTLQKGVQTENLKICFILHLINYFEFMVKLDFFTSADSY